MSPFLRKRHVLLTRFTAEECHERLRARARTLHPETWEEREKRPVAGRVSSRGFSLLKRQRYSSSFQTVASGRLISGPSGTRIEVRMGMSVLVLVFTLVWLGAVGYAALGGLLLYINGGVAPGEASGLLMTVVMFAFGTAL